MEINKYTNANERFLKADVEIEKGKDYDFIIDRVTEEELENMGKTDTKPAIWFRKHEKGLVLNKTNARMLVDNFNSTETDDWLGRKVKLFRTMTSSPTGMVPCIRVRPHDGAEAETVVDEPSNILQSDDEIPY